MGRPILPGAGQRCIVIDDLRLDLFIGVHQHERQARQQVSITIHMLVPDPGPPVSDDLADHVSYSDVIAKLKERARSARHVNLVETLAEEVAGIALAEARVESVIVDVRKTQIVPEARSVGVVIRRERAPRRGPG
jgi:dihydroneopterin aldolase